MIDHNTAKACEPADVDVRMYGRSTQVTQPGVFAVVVKAGFDRGVRTCTIFRRMNGVETLDVEKIHWICCWQRESASGEQALSSSAL